jgi:sulfate transport system permease protein
MTSTNPVKPEKKGSSKLTGKKNILPGFGLSLGFSLFYLSLFVLIPLATLFFKASGLGTREFWQIVTSPRVVASYQLSLGASFLAACINAFFGLIVAWVLVRYPSGFSRFLDSLVDLPFALPTAVAGISLASLYSANGWIGELLAPMGIRVAYTPLGIVVALVFIGLPFVVRTVQPVIQDLDREVEEAAACLGANRSHIFWRVIFPEILPPLLTGFALAFARAIGEYGSVIFIAGNIPLRSEIAPLLMMIKLEQFDYAGAVAIALIMLAISFVLLLGINLLQGWQRRYQSSEPA